MHTFNALCIGSVGTFNALCIGSPTEPIHNFLFSRENVTHFNAFAAYYTSGSDRALSLIKFSVLVFENLMLSSDYVVLRSCMIYVFSQWCIHI